jgi:hypothetical protein
MRLLVFVAFLFLFPSLASANAVVECTKGPHTTLQFISAKTPSYPLLNQSIGRTTLNIRSTPGDEIISSTEFEGKWFCFGYNELAHFFVIGGIFQKGASLPLASIRYLSEDGKVITPSSFDRSGYHALSSVTSPSGRYIVFIGGRLTTDGLYALDTKRDQVRKLGRAPLPPPNEDLRSLCGDEPFEWGGCWADGYLEMDSSILRFRSDTELEVRYGKDGSSARAKKRRISRFRLDS